ncbi:hypothetical protein DLM_3229 [Aquitalea magnusonii]|uniref:Uncharacterized protein n=1 Tax=Aquitalea magnusonii TaxID=332411 RepID=A0A3G9GKV8_9NEIS|nr:hypothetical protein DLM_3229 [Aquitalea magnusonii]
MTAGREGVLHCRMPWAVAVTIGDDSPAGVAAQPWRLST